MNETKPLLSIVVATKNRVRYCIDCIETTLSHLDTDFELIIQDNTDNYDLRGYIESRISDSRLVYNYSPPPFSSIDNFNAAMELATGEYVCLLGDDDAILPDLIKITRLAFENDIDSVAPKNIISYNWPDEKNNGSKLDIPDFSYSKEFVILEKQLNSYLRDGCAKSYRIYGLPSIYHGIVRRECMVKIKSLTGHYFGGLSPDSYSSVALSQIVKNHIIVDYPLTIAGACQTSTTSQSTKGNHRGLLKNAPHFRDRSNYVWLKIIPEYYSVETIWSESALRALFELNKFELLSKFSPYYLVSYSLINNLGIKSIIYEYTNLYIKQNHLNVLKFYFKALFLCSKLIFMELSFLRLKRKISLRNHKLYNNIINIKEAIDIIVTGFGNTYSGINCC